MDNIYSNCPAMMSDARFLSDNKTATRRNEYIKYVNNIVRDDDYRMFLQQNGSQISNNVWEFHKKNDSCNINGSVHTFPINPSLQQLAAERQAYEKHAANGFKSANTNKDADMRLS